MRACNHCRLSFATPATLAGGLRLSDFESFDPLRHADQGFLGFVTAFPAIGSSTYHAGSADFSRRFSRGMLFRANYTLAHNIDDSTNELFSSRVNPRRPQNWSNLREDRGRSVLDIRHKLALSWVYELPRLGTNSDFLGILANGWQWSGTYLVQSGQPVSILSGVDSNANGDSAGDRGILNPFGTGNKGTGVNFVCAGAGGVTSIAPAGADCLGGSAAVAGYVAQNPSARYVQAGVGTRSNLGRNSFETPGMNIWNMSILKNTRLTERFSAQFRVSAMNVFNHRNYTLAQPSVFQSGVILGTVNNALSSTYANVTADQFLDATQFTGGARQMQLGFKLFW